MFRESDHPRNLEVDSSEKQLQKIVVIENASAGRISVAEAAEALGRGEPQVKQLKRQFDRTDSRWMLHRAAITSTRGSTTRTMREAGAGFHHVDWTQPDEFRPGPCEQCACATTLSLSYLLVLRGSGFGLWVPSRFVPGFV